MAANGPTELPAYIQLRYQENGVFDSFSSAAEKAASDAKKRFNQAFSETERVVTDAVGRMSTQFSKLDLGVGDLRQGKVQLTQYRDALSLVSQAATKLAADTGDTTRETREYLRALREQTSEAERALKVAEAQITTYSRLQTELDKVSIGKGPDLRDAVQRLRDGDAAIDRAALSGATLESVLGRVANKGREVSDALKQAAKSAEVAAKAQAAALAAQGPVAANALPTNTKFGSDALLAGQASLDRAAVSGTTLEQVLGRVAAKGQTVTAAINEMAVADKRATSANTALATSIDRLHAELDPAVAATQRYASALALLDKALEAGVIDGDQHALMLQKVNSASRDGTTALKSVINSQGAFRVAMIQSGQQMQDVAVSLYGGQKAALVFAQQLPQLAFALSGLEGNANKTYDRIGRFATFLSGPMGLAVGLAVGVLGTLAARMLNTGEEADNATKHTYDFSTSLDVLTLSAKNSADAMQQLADATKSAIREQGDFLDQQAATADAAVTNLEKRISDRQKQMDALKKEMDTWTVSKQVGLDASDIYRGYQYSNLKADQEADKQALANARLSKTNTDLALSQRRVTDATDASAAATDTYNIAVAKLNDLRTRSAKLENNGDPLAIASSTKEYVSASEYEKRLTALKNTRDAALKAAAEAKRQSNEVDRQFGREINLDAAKSIATAAGFKITSDLRTKAEQQWLYDNKRTAENPVAVPGTSAHEKGNALDIAFGAGVSEKTIKKAFADQGVRLTKLLKETGHFHIEWSTTGADKAQREADAIAKHQQQLQQWSDRTAESVARINEQFDDQPRFIDRAAQAGRQLDQIIAQTQAAMKDPTATAAMQDGFKQIIADAEHAKGTIEEALVRPFQELLRDSTRRVQIQELLAQGREDEADALRTIWEMEERNGEMTEAQRRYVENVVLAEKERTRELQRQQDLFHAQLDVVSQVKDELTSLLSGDLGGKNLVKSIQTSLKQYSGKKLFDELFGDAFDELDKALRKQSPLGKESQALADEMSVATTSFRGLIEAINGTSSALGRDGIGLTGAANDNSVAGGFDNAQYQAALASIQAGQTPGIGDTVTPDIAVTGKRPIDISMKSTTDLANKLAHATVAPFTQVLSDVFGTKFGQMMGGIMESAYSGFLTGGTTGGILGGLKGIVDKTDIFGGASGAVSAKLGIAGQGAAMGTMSDSLMKALGVKSSKTGAQLGGAAGALAFGPLGGLVGSVAGGLIGGLFKHNTSASAHVSNTGVTVAGADTGNYKTATGLGASVQDGLANIIKQLGGTTGTYSVAIGTRGDSYRVNTSGTSLKTKNGAKDFGDDEEAAIKYAIMDAINDGAVQGIRESTKRLLKAGDDLDTALQNALDWENVFKELKSYKDPIGAALDDLDSQFEKLIDLGKQAGASADEMAQLEELYGIKRNEIIKEQAEQLISSLKGLYTDLTTGDNGLSLRDRESAALTTYNSLAARVASGDTTAYDDYADAAQTLLDIERQLYGSQQEYFDRLNEVTALTKSRIDAETNVVSIAQDRDSPFDSTGAVNTSITTQTEVLSSQLDAVNTNLGTIAALIASTGSTSSAAAARLAFANSY